MLISSQTHILSILTHTSCMIKKRPPAVLRGPSGGPCGGPHHGLRFVLRAVHHKPDAFVTPCWGAPCVTPDMSYCHAGREGERSARIIPWYMGWRRKEKQCNTCTLIRNMLETCWKHRMCPRTSGCSCNVIPGYSYDIYIFYNICTTQQQYHVS